MVNFPHRQVFHQNLSFPRLLHHHHHGHSQVFADHPAPPQCDHNQKCSQVAINIIFIRLKTNQNHGNNHVHHHHSSHDGDDDDDDDDDDGGESHREVLSGWQPAGN